MPCIGFSGLKSCVHFSSLNTQSHTLTFGRVQLSAVPTTIAMAMQLSHPESQYPVTKLNLIPCQKCWEKILLLGVHPNDNHLHPFVRWTSGPPTCYKHSSIAEFRAGGKMSLGGMGLLQYNAMGECHRFKAIKYQLIRCRRQNDNNKDKTCIPQTMFMQLQ